jgi:hypothetical protein
VRNKNLTKIEELVTYSKVEVLLRPRHSLENQLKETPPFREKRKYPRAVVSLPVSLRINENGGGYPGFTVDASKCGLQIQTLKEIPVRTRLKVEIYFPDELRLSKFSEKAEVVWRDVSNWDDLEGYQYGIEFAHISKENDLNLSKMINDPSSTLP